MIFGLIALIAAVVAYFIGKGTPQRSPLLRFLPWIFVVIGIIVIGQSSVVVIDPGHVGVQALFGDVLDEVLPNGLHVINPFVDVIQMDTKTQAYTMSGKANEGQLAGDDAIETLSNDGLTLRLELTVQYRLSQSEAAKVYRNIGVDYVEKVVRPEIRSAIRDGAVSYVATDLYSTKRDEFMLNVKKRIEKAFSERGIILENALLRDIELPERVREAINEKIAAEQESQQMVYVLQKETQEAERKRVEAKGISDAQTIISSSLSSQYLQYNYIQTLKSLADGKNSTFVIAPMDQKLTPMINVAK